jgi:predicted O-methyltransferase YrrM
VGSSTECTASGFLAGVRRLRPSNVVAPREVPERERGNRLKRLARRAAHRLAQTPTGRRAIKIILKDEETVAFVFRHLSALLSAEASFERAAPPRDEVRGFEHCAWLFSSNLANHGLSRLTISEAAYLYDLVRSLTDPEVVEIGRFRGGSTFLFAAAGGYVLSIDLDSERQRADDEALRGALFRFGMREPVELELADSQTYAFGDRHFDVAFIDGDHQYAGVRADFEHWWPAIAPGGNLVFHDSTPGNPLTEGVVRAVEEVRERDDLLEVPGAPDTLAHFVKQPARPAAVHP